jgi:sphingomyelin phosphodiesterase acid-like 3
MPFTQALILHKPMRRRWPLCLLAVALWLGGSKQCFSKAPGHRFLIASDIHFNPFADRSLVADLAAAPPEQWEGILDRSTPAATSPYGQDSNWWLLKSALDAMRATEPHPALVMITGDLLAHNFPQTYASVMHDSDREHYRAFVRKTVVFLAAELRQRFKKSQILLTPGNNDNECGDYDIEAGGPFLDDTAEVVHKLARAGGRMKSEWKALGSYSVQPVSIPGLRILSVNTVFFSNKYQATSFANACSPVDSNAAGQTFSWLESNLVQAKQANQKVWIMFHIPPGIDGYASMMQMQHAGPGQCAKAIVPMWKPVWTSRFDGLTEKFQGTIMASFAGHTHTDDFRVLPGGGFVLIDPPVSPVYGQNPAFRVVSITGDGGVTDQSTYYLNNQQWTREYSFIAEWHSPSIDGTSLKSIDEGINHDPEARTRWLTLLNVSSTHDAVPPNGVPALDCAISALEPATYEACACATTAP